MPYKFDAYSYFGNIDSTKRKNDYAINPDVIASYKKNNDYQGLYDYMMDYQFADVNVDGEWVNKAEQVFKEGRIRDRIYSNLDRESKAKADIWNKVFSPEFDDDLTVAKRHSAEYNSLISEFNNLKNKLGGTNSDNIILTFPSQKQTLFGIDWISPDYVENPIDVFYKTSGFDRNRLIACGIKVKLNDDESTTLIVPKNNRWANQILYDAGNNGYEYAPKITGDNTFDNIWNNVSSSLPPNAGDLIDLYTRPSKFKKRVDDFVQPYADKSILRGNGPTDKDYSNFMYFLHDCSDIYNQAYRSVKNTDVVTTSVIGSMMSDALNALNTDYENGLIDDKEYDRKYKRIDRDLYDLINNLSVNEPIEANIDDSTGKVNDDDSLQPIYANKRKLISKITATNRSKLHFSACYSDGDYGVLISIAGKDLNEKDTDELSNYSDRTLVFIPGLYNERVQQTINNDGYLKACKEYNDMSTWGYDYTTVDGKKINAIDDKISYINGNERTKIDAVNEMTKDLVKKRYNRRLKYDFINAKGEVTNIEGYDDRAKMIAVSTMEDIYPNIPLTDTYNNPLPIDALFNRTNLTDAQINGDEAIDNVTAATYKKIKEIREVYNYIMKGLDGYKIKK